MERPGHDDVKDDTLHKKLERVSTRNWWPGYKFDKEEFHIYCEVVIYEADLLEPGFIGGEKYKRLVKMSDERLRQYLSRSRRSRWVRDLR